MAYLKVNVKELKVICYNAIRNIDAARKLSLSNLLSEYKDLLNNKLWNRFTGKVYSDECALKKLNSLDFKLSLFMNNNVSYRWTYNIFETDNFKIRKIAFDLFDSINRLDYDDSVLITSKDFNELSECANDQIYIYTRDSRSD